MPHEIDAIFALRCMDVQIIGKENGIMNETIELDFKKLFKTLLKRSWIIVLCAILVGSIMLVYSTNFATPMYTASVTMYVNNNNGYTGTVTSQNLAVALQLVKTYVNIIQSDTVLEKVKDEAGLALSAGAIRNMMTASSVDETEVFRVTITSHNAELSALIANTIADVAPTEIPAIIDGSSAKVIDYANVPTSPSSPNIMTNTVMGVLVGAVLAALAIVLHVLLDVRIKEEKDLEGICDIPVLGRIPDMTLLAKNADKKVKR